MITIYPANCVKRELNVATWQFGVELMPDDVRSCLWHHPTEDFTLVINPNSLAISKIVFGDFVIQTKHGCVYGVPKAQFEAKYVRNPSFDH